MIHIDEDVSRAIDALPTKVNSFGYDAWGFSPKKAKLVYTLIRRALWSYFRPKIQGIENLPAGRVLIVPNHSGQLPLDAALIALACLLRAEPPRLVRSMVERWFPKLPLINEVLWRGGAVLGDPINCRNLLLDEQAILVFPEGAKGSGKVWFDRYQLQKFGRGFMRLALATQSPIVPCAVVGGEESIVSLYDWKGLAKLLGFPYAPIHPLLPLLGPFAYLPLPVRFHITFGKPMMFEGPHDDDDAVIDEKVAKVKYEVKRLIDEGLAQRKGLFT